MFQVNNTSKNVKLVPTGQYSLAGGAGSVVSVKNAVALGINPVADRDDTVSVGAIRGELPLPSC